MTGILHLGAATLEHAPIAGTMKAVSPTEADESTVEAIGDWRYWVAQGYCV
jgi:hypothetical protein